MRHNYIPAPHTIYQGVHKLEPGTILTLPWQGEPQISRFWNARTIAHNGTLYPLDGSDTDLTEQLEALLQDAVARRMIADVPLGAFLSGGVDSSTVVALMQQAGLGKVRTFSIGFEIRGLQRSALCGRGGEPPRTDHTELTVTSSQALDLIPRLPDIYDEPFADSSQIPTYLVSAMTRKHVTVALSGDGGDELFAGYNRYQLTERFWQALSVMPRAMRNAAAAALTMVRPDRWTSLAAMLPARLRPPQTGDKLYKMAAVLKLDNVDALYRRLVSHWEPSEVMLHAQEPPSIINDEKICARISRSSGAHAVFRSCHLFARRHLDQGRPRQHGGRIGSARSAARSPGRGIFVAAAAQSQGAKPHHKVDPAAGAVPACSARRLSNGRKWDLAFPWANGCAGRCATGLRPC